MKLLQFIAGGCLLLSVFTACDKDDDNNTSPLNQTDRDFMQAAAYSNLAEVDAGQLASTKGSVDSVKMYGRMMTTDHTGANAELHVVADSLKVSLPAAPDPEHQALKVLLTGLSGYSFDTAYINAQIRDHQKTIALFTNEVNNGQFSRLKAMASNKLPGLQAHLSLATQVAGKLRK